MTLNPFKMIRKWLLVPFLISVTPLGTAAFADESVSSYEKLDPVWMGLQESASPIMTGIHDFNYFISVILALIGLFVTVVLVYIFFRFNEKANPVPSKVTHNTKLEVIWTIVPCIILVVIAVPSFRLLDDQMKIPDGQRLYGSMEEALPAPTVHVKAEGRQWYWTYYYNDEQGEMIFDSRMLDEELRAEKKADFPDRSLPRLLAVDEEMVVPVRTTVQINSTAATGDVLHSFSVPSLGIKVDSVPDRSNLTWFYAEREGIYYGQCSELCGSNHAYMPIAIRVVSKENYDAWRAQMQDDYGAKRKTTDVPVDLAASQ